MTLNLKISTAEVWSAGRNVSSADPSASLLLSVSLPLSIVTQAALNTDVKVSCLPTPFVPSEQIKPNLISSSTHAYGYSSSAPDSLRSFARSRDAHYGRVSAERTSEPEVQSKANT